MATTPEPCWQQLPDGQLDTLAGCLLAIAHPTRLKLVCLLAGGERSVNDLAAELGIVQPLASQHLRILANRGVLRPRREGNRVYYGVRLPALHALLEKMRAVYCG